MMHKILGAVTFCALALLWAAPTPAQTDTLTGEMASFQFLIGTWDCSLAEIVPAGGTRQVSGTFTFTFTPPNSLSLAFSAPNFSESGTIHYDAQSQKYYQNMTNSLGGTSIETADSGMPEHTVFTGNGTQAGQTAPTRDTDDKIDDTHIHSVSEVYIGGTWTKVGDATCTKR